MNFTVLLTGQIAINQIFQMTQPTPTFALGKRTTAEGQVTVPKRMNFWKSPEQPLTPTSFLENHIAIFCQFHAQKPCLKF